PHAAPLTVAAVASRLGVAASTLRTWDRRYGLGPSSHEAGSHRRYTPADVARLERMRELTLQGVAPADAADLATRGEEDPVPSGEERPPARPEEGMLVDPLSLAAAAVEPDPVRTARMVDQVVRQDGIVDAWLSLVQPALGMIAQRGRTDRPGSDPEVVLADAVLAAVRAVASAADRNHRYPSDPRSRAGTGGSVLLLAGGEGRMRAHVIGAGLVERGIGARVLRTGTDVLEETRQVVAERGTRVLAVIGQPAGAEDVVRGVSEDGGVQVFLLGSDAVDVWLPGVQRVRTIRAAVDEIAEALAD
ncbi:MerR family transcriptional regulator, partial [Georgenia sp. 10Sc9-8]|nr:MerR family transcriptional regulator [Georgenia halotolerans]